MTPKLTIVGSGIIGLSVAEYFSRKLCLGKNVQIISNNDPHSGSFAAAANLATKGQLFGRDPHFQLKLEAKKIYREWLKSLLDENCCGSNINDIFKEGLGVDFFSSQECAEKHFKRVKQKDEELLALNLQLDSIQRLKWDCMSSQSVAVSSPGLTGGSRQIIYKNEMWVDGAFLLLLLKQILEKRNVNFVNTSFTEKNLKSVAENDLVIFCTGAWTKELLTQLALPLPEAMKKQERLSIGSTFSGKNIINNFNDSFALHEKISSSLKEKITISGLREKQFLSSSTVKMKSVFDCKVDELEFKNNEMINLAMRTNCDEPYLAEKVCLVQNNGLRVGYGHSEIVIEKLKVAEKNMFVCAGVHKSGFLFAPVVGALIAEKFC